MGVLLKICPEDSENVEYGNYCMGDIIVGQVVAYYNSPVCDRGTARGGDPNCRKPGTHGEGWENYYHNLNALQGLDQARDGGTDFSP